MDSEVGNDHEEQNEERSDSKSPTEPDHGYQSLYLGYCQSQQDRINTQTNRTIIGRMTPPRELPEAIIPKAMPRFLKNHVVMVLIAGSVEE